MRRTIREASRTASFTIVEQTRRKTKQKTGREIGGGPRFGRLRTIAYDIAKMKLVNVFTQKGFGTITTSDKFRVRRTVRAEIALREKGEQCEGLADEGAGAKVEGQKSPSRPGNLVLSF